MIRKIFLENLSGCLLREHHSDIKFEVGRFEGDQYISALHNDYTEQIFYLGTKWHGKLLVSGGTPLGPVATEYPHIDIRPNCSGISFVSARMANWGNTHLRASASASIVVSDSVISAAGTDRSGTISGMYGIDLQNCTACAITNNAFPFPGIDSGNKHGDVCVSGRGNIVTNNGCCNAELPIVYNDEFAKGNTSSGTIGSLGWTVHNLTAPAPTITIPGLISGHPGMVNVQCHSTNGTSGLALTTLPFITPSIYPLWVDPTKFFAITFVLKFPDYSLNDKVGYCFGLTDDVSPFNFLPANGIVFKMTSDNNNSAVSNSWEGATFSSGMSSATTAFSAPVIDNLLFHMFTIRRSATNKIGFIIDGGVGVNAEKTLTNNIPSTVPLFPYIAINKTGTSTQKSFILDSFELSLPNLGVT